jgi:hypothetical protein
VNPLAVFTLLAAPFIGSFLGVVVLRLEDGRPIVAGRSQCDSCHARLGPLDLVPLASWSFLRARCRHCGARLGFFYPAMEIAAIVPVALGRSSGKAAHHDQRSRLVPARGGPHRLARAGVFRRSHRRRHRGRPLARLALFADCLAW